LPVNDVSAALHIEAGSLLRYSRPLGIFATWRLQAYGYTLAAFYAAFFLYLYWLGLWLLNKSGVPLYHDFTNMFVAGGEALRGEAASVYDQVAHKKAQEALVGSGHVLFSIWPYPPIYFLLLAPLALLPYVAAFFIFELGTLLGSILVVYYIVRRRPTIALVLASPFTAWNFLAGQSGFLTATLVGAALLFLGRRPVLAGVFIGCLTYKPQFGILFPVALIAGGRWRAFVSAAATTALLAGASVAAFGIGAWVAFPQGLAAQAGLNLIPDAPSQWAYLQTVYGLIRYVNGGVTTAGLAQGVTTCGIAVIVWCLWRSREPYALRAAALSAGMLIASPYVLGYDLAAIAVPMAFLAREQVRTGWLRGEQTIMLALFAVSLSILPTAGRSPVGAVIMLTLFGLILRRALCYRLQATAPPPAR
jgi:arabinofuranan 3-O-arabinosyltransferase